MVANKSKIGKGGSYFFRSGGCPDRLMDEDSKRKLPTWRKKTEPGEATTPLLLGKP